MDRLSLKFTVERGVESSFQRIILPFAQNAPGLMHELLHLASKHINPHSDYGRQLRHDHDDLSIQDLEDRSKYHHDRAGELIFARVPYCGNRELVAAAFQLLARLMTTLVIFPDDTGAHRVHLVALQSLVMQLPKEYLEVISFLTEIAAYHISADRSMCHPKGDNLAYTQTYDWQISNRTWPSGSVRLLGVGDNSFRLMG